MFSDEGMATTAKQRYEVLSSDREPYLQRAERNAQLTIPLLFPEECNTGATTYEEPNQSTGARGVNNLSSKIMLSLFPPNESWYICEMGEDIVKEIGNDPKQITNIRNGLGFMEQQVLRYMQQNMYRVTLNEAVNQMLVSGNVLLYNPTTRDELRLYNMRHWVVLRDGMGEWIELVIKESVPFIGLPKNVQEQLTPPSDKRKAKELYTYVYKLNDKAYSFQEIDGVKLQGTDANYPIEVCPWFPVRLRKTDGENYSRAYVDDYIGDLKSHNEIAGAINAMAIIAAFTLYRVAPNAITSIEELKKKKSGSFYVGRENDVVAETFAQIPNIQILAQRNQDIKETLEFAFLLNSAVQRDAERVTAEEIRYVAQELEDTVGNIYSLLAQELQMPLLKTTLNKMMSKGIMVVVKFGKQGIEPKVTTGVEALGRGHDFQQITQFLNSLSLLPSAQAFVRVNEVASSLATSLGLDASQLIMSMQEYIANQQQQVGNQMAMNAAPQMVNAAAQQQQGGQQ